MTDRQSERGGTSLPMPFGRYELLEQIGSGGMASLYRARLQGPGDFEKIVVIKRIHPHLARNRTFVKMLQAEAALCARLQHPNIVEIYELGQVGEQPYIAMEYIDGYDLLDVLTQATQRGIAVPGPVGVHVVAEVAAGLHYAHAARDGDGRPLHIIHRDVSPSNILLAFDGRVKLTDFGVARANVRKKHHTRSGVLKGKIGYMAPEQVLGEPFDHRADIFSLGIVLFEVLTLKRLFLGRTELETLINIRDARIDERLAKHPEVPGAIASIVRKALARNPVERYATAGAMRDALLGAASGLGWTVSNEVTARFLADLSEKGTSRGSRQTAPVQGSAHEIRFEPARNSDGAAADIDKTPVDPGARREVSRLSTSPGASSAPFESVSSTSRRRLRITPEHGDWSLVTRAREGSADSPGTSFRLRGRDGRIFGPVTWQNLLGMVRAHSVSEWEDISVDGGPWRSVASFDALRHAAPSVFGTPAARPARSEGPLSQLNLPRLLCRLYVERTTGVLRLSRGECVKEVWLRAGRPRHIASSIKEELFGHWLVARGVLQPQELERAIARGRSHSGRLGEALLALGMLRPHELYELLRRHFEDKFDQLFAWKHGWHEIREAESLPAGFVPLDLDPLPAITRGVWRHVSEATADIYLRGHLDQPLKINRSARVPVDALRLPVEATRALAWLEAEGTVRRAIHRARRARRPPVDVLRTAFLLHQVRVLEFEER